MISKFAPDYLVRCLWTVNCRCSLVQDVLSGRTDCRAGKEVMALGVLDIEPTEAEETKRNLAGRGRELAVAVDTDIQNNGPSCG